MEPERTIKSETIYRGKVVSLRLDTVELPGGRSFNREIVEHTPVVHIVPVDSQGRVLLVRQYRAPAGAELLETPAGGVDPNENIEEAAQRELREETGYRAGAFVPMTSFYSSPGFCTELNHIFLATDLTYDPLERDVDEEIRVEVVPVDQALRLVREGKIGDGKSIAGLLIYAMYYRNK